MPKLLAECEIRLEFADIGLMTPKQRVYSGKRSPGVHLSGIIKQVMVTAGLLTPDELADLMPLRMAVGMAWEQWIVQLWPDLIWQPKEVCRDGIYGSPDGITPGDPTMLEEVKATWMSRMEKGELTKGVPAPRSVLTIKRWMLQLAGYCLMLGLNRARLHVLWVNGDYRGSGPQYFTYLIEFTNEELTRMWNNMILPNKDSAQPEVYES